MLNSRQAFTEIKKWIEQGGNYGILGGYGDLIIIDADDEGLSQVIKEGLPNTFTVKTPLKGCHFYFYCKDIKKKIILTQIAFQEEI